MPTDKKNVRAGAKASVKTSVKANFAQPGNSPRVPIVSSLHLASGRSKELSEFEFGMIIANNAFNRWIEGMIIANNAFNRWIVRCISAAGMKDMTPTDVLVLHHINHRAREKKLADIAFILNIEDAHIVNYSLKKLHAQGLVNTERRGKEVLYSTNEAGQDLCKRYYEIRERLLVSGLTGDDAESFELAELARFLRILSGLYEQAARSATSM